MKTVKSLEKMAAITALLLVAGGAKAQYNPYQGGSFGQHFVFMGYGAPPLVLSGNGQVQPYLNTYGAPYDPNLYNGYSYGGYPQEDPYLNAYENDNPYQGYASYGYPQYGYPQNVWNQSAFMGRNTYNIPPQYGPANTSDQIDARRDSSGRIVVSWDGNRSVVSRITYVLMDAQRRPLQMRTITAPPTQVRFANTTRAAYYQVIVQYVNGTTSTVTAPIR